ncbi:MAG: DNA/RNA nuclease SfsA [Nitrospira sp.]|nr:DNA/RNA nuclease SfsA [Nitrospira sp.]
MKTLEFQVPLHQGTLLKRYKRFLADVRLEDGRELTVMCPNTGTMKTCNEPGRPVIISDSLNDSRKYRFTWEMIRMGRSWVGVNTGNPNRAVTKWVEAGMIPELTGYGTLKREQKYGRDGRSRIDLLLSDGAAASDCFVEVKNTTMRVGHHAAFPDAVTTRGQKHLRELMDVVDQGGRGVMFYFVGRADCDRFRPADEIDPEYGRLLREAATKGVELLPYRVRFNKAGMKLEERLPVDL